MSQNIYFPDITVNKLAADLTVGNTAQRVLFVGQQINATVTSGALVTEIQNDNSWDTLFGAKSMIAGGIRAFRDINQEVRIDAIPLDDAVTAPTSGFLTTISMVGNLGNFQTTSDGAISIDIDGLGPNDITGMDFNSPQVTDIADIAAVLDTAISGVTVTESGDQITFTSNTTGSSSSIVITAPGSGTNVADSGFLSVTNPGTVIVDGLNADEAASTSLTFSGIATESGTITVSITSLLDYSFPISVSDGFTETNIADALVILINASVNAPFSATNVAGVVTCIAANNGEEGNVFSTSVSGVVAGITTTLTTWFDGDANPDLTDIFDVIGDTRYQTIVWPCTYDLTEIATLLSNRFNANGQILDGVGMIACTKSFADAKSAVEALNNQSLWIETNVVESDTTLEGGVIVEIDYVRASQLAAVRSLRLTPGANITNLTVTNAPKDQVGGPSIATLPYANTPFPNLPIIKTGRGLTQTQIKELRTAGSFVFGNNLNNTGIILGEVVSTYKTDAVGNPDLSFKFGNFVDTISNVAEYFFNNLRNDFKSSRLTLGDLKDGFSMENKKSLTAQIIKYYQDLTGPVFLLLQDGEDARKFFVKNLVLDIDLLTGTVTFSAKVPIITQIRVITGQIQLAFDINDLAIAA